MYHVDASGRQILAKISTYLGIIVQIATRIRGQLPVEEQACHRYVLVHDLTLAIPVVAPFAPAIGTEHLNLMATPL
jgi:hypothetical protein